MVSLLQAFLISVGVAVLVLASVLLGGWLVFKSKAGPGEGFIIQPKGQVFTMPEAADAPDEPPDTRLMQDEVLKNSERFLNSFLGGGKT